MQKKSQGSFSSFSKCWSMTETGWKQLGKDKNFIVVWPDGMADSPSSMGSWNCSMSTGGPLGPTCDLDRHVHMYFKYCTTE